MTRHRRPDLPTLVILSASLAAFGVLVDDVQATVVAQEAPTTAILGRVADPAGLGVAEVRVILIGTDYSGTTNAEGAFLIPGIPVGPYVAGILIGGGSAPGLYPHAFPIRATDGSNRILLEISRLAIADSLVHLADADQDVIGTLVELGIPVPGETPIARYEEHARRPVRVRGVVQDAQSGRAIPSAAVRFAGATRTFMTDAHGRFTIADVPPGAFRISAEALGYATRQDELVVLGDADLDVTIQMTEQPIELDPIVVEARSEWLARTGFYDRRDDPANNGTIFTRKDIVGHSYSSVADLMYRIPGAEVQYIGVGRRVVRFRRVIGMRGTGGCSPPVYLDGMRVGDAWEFISPEWIEAVEVYIGGASTPVRFFNPCGAVLVWTRR